MRIHGGCRDPPTDPGDPQGCRDPPTAHGDPWKMQRCTQSPWHPWGMQRSTHSLWGSMGDAEIHPQPMGKVLTSELVMPERGCDPVGDLEKRSPLLPGWSSLSLEDCTPRNSDPHHSNLGGLCAHGKDSCCSSFGRTAAHEIGLTLEKFMENCLPYEGPHVLTGEGLLSQSSGRKISEMSCPKPPCPVSLHCW
ncbi:hypothetical protein TURU_014449 [Turdus rufiventris]|nr:hypothetical protein TURU_014449 [Turdus rufiventris]